MKKTYRSLFCLLAVLLLSVSVLPSASALFSQKLYYYGTVEGVSRTVEGKVESILVSAEEQETYQMIVTDSTVWQDHDEKTTSDPATLAVGEQICGCDDVAAAAVGGVYRHPQLPRRHGSGTGSPRCRLPGEEVLCRHPQSHFGLVLPDHAHLSVTFLT